MMSDKQRKAGQEGGLSFAGESPQQRGKRKARVDMHTDLEGFLAKIDLSNASPEELKALLARGDITSGTKAKIESELKQRLDPEDQDAVEV